MKYIIAIVAVLFLFSCGRQEQRRYVKAVHNPCTGRWAVETGFGHSFMSVVDNQPFEKLFYGSHFSHSGGLSLITISGGVNLPDTVDNAPIGKELQFPDSATAIRSYIQNISEPLRKRDSALHAIDSIYKCNHTYQ